VGCKGGGVERGEKWPKHCMHIWRIIKKKENEKKRLKGKTSKGKMASQNGEIVNDFRFFSYFSVYSNSSH
jgi:hypothetical protein